MKAITTGQEKQCVRLVTDAAEKAAEEALAELKKISGTDNAVPTDFTKTPSK
jgi:hypothetical protein